MRLSILATLLLTLASCGETKQPQLVAGLERLPADEARRELDRRLAERFVAGTPEKELEDKPRADGFQVGEQALLCAAPQCAWIELWPDRLGGVGWSVQWTADDNRKLRRVWSGGALLN